jgi:hypothetical protein
MWASRAIKGQLGDPQRSSQNLCSRWREVISFAYLPKMSRWLTTVALEVRGKEDQRHGDGGA